MKQTLLQRLIERRDRLDAAIGVLRDEFGEEIERAANRKARQALHSSNGGAPIIAGLSKREYNARYYQQRKQAHLSPEQKKRKYEKEKQRRAKLRKPPPQVIVGNRNAFRGTDREIKQIPVPSGVSFEGIDLSKAIALAVRAVDEPIPTPELRLLLETAGVKFPKLRQPRNRYVGMLAARLADSGEIKRTAEGWTKGKR